ncbi:hypothetical protein ACHQM5_007762 [Ranunculus cassubicifolius]
MVKSLVPVSPSMAPLRLKLIRIVYRHKQMKSAFSDLRSQIKTGLIEAEDVFASLSIPLMKLVGIKTNEMAQQGRSSTIFMDSQPPQQGKERDCYNKAAATCKILIDRQQLQLQQLVYLLRQIEARVNSRQENILQTLDEHRVYFHNFFEKSIQYLSSIHQTTDTDKAFLMVTYKLLRAIYKHVGSALESVQNGVEDLMTELGEHMCKPMTGYVRSLKTEMEAGAFIRLVSAVKEVEQVLRDGQSELEEARKKARIEEEKKMEALRKLKESEERKLETLSRLRDSEENRKAMKEFIGFLLQAKKKSKQPFTRQKLLALEEDQAEDEKLLWDLLREKNNGKVKASPMGPKELLHVEPNKSRRHRADPRNSARREAKVSHRPVTRSSTAKGFGPETPCPDPWPRLGSSPSMVDHSRQTSPSVHVRRGALHR